MSFNKEAFVAEMDTMLDAVEAESAGVVPDEMPDGEVEAKEGVVDEKSVEDVDDKAGGTGDTAVDEEETGGDDGPTGEEGDQEGSGDTGEEAKDGLGKIEISDHAIEQAVLAGISIADAKSFGNEESLLRVVDSVQRRSASEQSTEQEVSEVDGLDDLVSKIPDLNPEDFQPEVVTMFGAMKDIIQQQQESIRDIRDQQSAASEARLQSSREEITGWFDSEISGLGEDFTESLGEGGYDSLRAGSPQLAKRDEIAANMEVMLTGYAASGRKAPPRGEVFKTAARIVLHDEFKQQANSKVAGKLAKRSSSHIQRGSGKKTKSQLTPEEETVQMLDRKYPSQR